MVHEIQLRERIEKHKAKPARQRPMQTGGRATSLSLTSRRQANRSDRDAEGQRVTEGKRLVRGRDFGLQKPEAISTLGAVRQPTYEKGEQLAAAPAGCIDAAPLRVA